MGMFQKTGTVASTVSRSAAADVAGKLGAAGVLLGKGVSGVFKRGPKRPRDLNGVRVDARTGNVMQTDAGPREPFVLVSRLNLAAGVQSATASLGDFFTTTACGQLTQNNQIPFDTIIEEARLYVGADLVATPVENPAALMGFYIIELKNSREVARYSLADLGAVFGYTGLVTSGATAAVCDVPGEGVEFDEHYDPTLVYALQLWNTRALTTVSILDFTLILTGTRA